MDPPAKRQRLETVPRFSTDDDAFFSEDDEEQLLPEIRDRLAIRNRFKSALEGIFEKYGHDFTGIGDEIDLRTGEVVVDNGHIMRMKGEGDAGGDPTLSEEDLSVEEELDESDTEATDTGTMDLPGGPIAAQRANGQQKKGQALESLNLDMIVNKLSQSSQGRSTSLAVKAKDPKWQIPDVPESVFGGATENESDSADDSEAREISDLGLQHSKSPKKSLWSDARFTRICKRVPSERRRRRKRQIPTAVWHDALGSHEATSALSGDAHDRKLHTNQASYIQNYGSEIQRHQFLGTAERATNTIHERTTGQPKESPSDVGKEWSIPEEQQLIRYRLNTPLSFAALAPKFPGRSAEMLRDKWQHLKKKLIEVATATTANTNAIAKGPTTEVYVRQPRTSEKQSLDNHNNQDKTDGSSEPGSKEISNEKAPARFEETDGGAHELGNSPSAAVDLLGIPLEDMWKTFPAIGQLQNADNEPNHGEQNQEEFEFDMTSWQHPIWQNQVPQAASLSFSVPYGPLEHTDSVLQDQGDPSVPPMYQPAQSGGMFDSGFPMQDVINGQTISLDVLGANDIGRASPTVASPVELTTTASETLAQETNYTPESLRSFMHNTHELILPDTETVDPWITHYEQQQLGAPPYFGSVSYAEMTQPSQKTSIPNTTQDDGSSMFLKSSGNHLESFDSAHEHSEFLPSQVETTGDTIVAEASQMPQVTADKSPESSALRSRESSPLSSISSSDPRMARSSELLSSIPRKDVTIDELPAIASEMIDPAILVKAPTETSKRKGIETQATPKAKSHDSQGVIAMTSLHTTLPSQETESATGTTEKPVKRTERPDKSANGSKQKLSTGTKDRLKISMGFVDNTMQMLNNSLEQSCVLLETATKRRPVTGPSAGKEKHFPGRPLPEHKSSAIVTQNKTPRSGLQDHSSSKKMSRTKAQQIRESAESLWNTFDEFNQVTTQDTQQRAVTLPKKNAVLNQSNSLQHKRSVRDQDLDSTSDPQFFQNARETTPIDTYRYMLADPWPAAPLPNDRIPGIWDASATKDKSSSIHKTSGSTVHDRNKALIPSSTSISSDVENVESEIDQESLTKGQRQSIGVPLPGQLIQSRHDKLVIVADSKVKKNINQEKLKTKMPRPAKPLSTNSSFIEHDSQGQKSRLSKHSTQDKPTKTRKEDPPTHKLDNKPLPPESPGRFAVDGSAPSPRKSSPTVKSADLLLEFGKGRPLTRANLLSQDEVPSTSQDTVLSFLNSQATQLSRPASTSKSSLLARHVGQRSASPAKVCGVNGFQCGRTLCFKCTSRTAKQGEVEF